MPRQTGSPSRCRIPVSPRLGRVAAVWATGHRNRMALAAYLRACVALQLNPGIATVLFRERYANLILQCVVFSGSLYAWAQRDSGEGQTGASWSANAIGVMMFLNASRHGDSFSIEEAQESGKQSCSGPGPRIPASRV